LGSPLERAYSNPVPEKMVLKAHEIEEAFEDVRRAVLEECASHV
jgi:hypothetical protein